MTAERLAGKVALVTGGGAGIGRAVCYRFAAEGACVVVGDIDATKGEETCGAIHGSGGEAHFVQLDVRDEASWHNALSAVVTSYGGLDILVNNAGLPYRRSLEQSTLEEWHELMAVNGGGMFLGMKHGARVVAERGGGSVVNVSSAAALTGVPGMISYSATKGAVRSMSRVAAMELADRGVRVNSVYPTSVSTAMAESDARDTGVSVTEFLEAASQMSPLDRIAEPEDVANAVLFLASEESRFITGSELVIDGGATAGFA